MSSLADAPLRAVATILFPRTELSAAALDAVAADSTCQRYFERLLCRVDLVTCAERRAVKRAADRAAALERRGVMIFPAHGRARSRLGAAARAGAAGAAAADSKEA